MPTNEIDSRLKAAEIVASPERDKASPRPWRVELNPVVGAFILDALGNEIGCLDTNDGLDDPVWFDAEANAELIVAAVNAYQL